MSTMCQEQNKEARLLRGLCAAHLAEALLSVLVWASRNWTSPPFSLRRSISGVGRLLNSALQRPTGQARCLTQVSIVPMPNPALDQRLHATTRSIARACRPGIQSCVISIASANALRLTAIASELVWVAQAERAAC